MSMRHPVNAAGWLYGAVITASLFTLAGAHPAEYPRILLVVLLTLVMYWLAHVYTRVIADRLADPSAALGTRIREALHHELSILVGSVPAVVAYIVFVALGLTAYATWAALWVSVLLLGVVGFRIGRQAGGSFGRLVLETVGCAMLGVVMIGLKTVLH